MRLIAAINKIEILNKGNIELRNEKKKPIYCCDKQGNFIKSFDAIADATRWCVEQGLCETYNSGARSHISNVCMGKRKSAYGYIWRYVD